MMSNKSVKRREGLKPANDSSTSGKEIVNAMALNSKETNIVVLPSVSEINTNNDESYIENLKSDKKCCCVKVSTVTIGTQTCAVTQSEPEEHLNVSLDVSIRANNLVEKLMKIVDDEENNGADNDVSASKPIRQLTKNEQAELTPQCPSNSLSATLMHHQPCELSGNMSLENGLPEVNTAVHTESHETTSAYTEEIHIDESWLQELDSIASADEICTSANKSENLILDSSVVPTKLVPKCKISVMVSKPLKNVCDISNGVSVEKRPPCKEGCMNKRKAGRPSLASEKVLLEKSQNDKKTMFVDPDAKLVDNDNYVEGSKVVNVNKRSTIKNKKNKQSLSNSKNSSNDVSNSTAISHESTNTSSELSSLNIKKMKHSNKLPLAKLSESPLGLEAEASAINENDSQEYDILTSNEMLPKINYCETATVISSLENENVDTDSSNMKDQTMSLQIETDQKSVSGHKLSDVTNEIMNHKLDKLSNSLAKSMDCTESTKTVNLDHSSIDTVELNLGASTSNKRVIKKKNYGTSSKKRKLEDTFMALPALATYPSLGPGPLAVPKTGRKYVGAHISAAGGIHNVFNNARAINAKSFAMFMRSQRQWIAKPFTDDHVARYKEQSKSFASHLILPHGSYLMNVGSSKPDLLQKSRDLLVEELGRCHQLGIPHFNFHPGSCVGGSSRADCCRTIAESINIAHSKVPDVIVVLENMCKQGNTIGGDFHELRLIIELVDDRTRVGVCLDTCHAHNAGYDLSTEDGFNSMISDFEKIIGFQFLRGLHINDSKNEAGAHVDRHECIGKGHIGIEGMKRIMNCDLFNDLPLILETPYTDDAGYAKEILMLEGLINSNNCEVKPSAVKGKRGRKKKEVQKVKEENLMEANVPKGKRKRSSIDGIKELRQEKSESCENNAKKPVKQEPVEVSEAKSTAQRGKKIKSTKAN